MRVGRIDGHDVLADVELVGDSADVGQSVPALYEGQGEPPDAVFAPWWTGLTENAFYLALGLGFFLEPLGRLVGAFALRRRPPTGRRVEDATDRPTQSGDDDRAVSTAVVTVTEMAHADPRTSRSSELS